MIRRYALAVAIFGTLAACSSAPRTMDHPQSTERLRAAETAFAQTMADRDLAAFTTFIAEDAVFINGGKPLRGRAAIVEHWKRFYATPQPPFSWKPERVEVLDSGTLGYSEGPVASPSGAIVARYYSTWRLDGSGRWKVVFDNGYAVCNCPK